MHNFQDKFPIFDSLYNYEHAHDRQSLFLFYFNFKKEKD